MNKPNTHAPLFGMTLRNKYSHNTHANKMHVNKMKCQKRSLVLQENSVLCYKREVMLCL